MISISSLAQRFRPRPAVLPSSQSFLSGQSGQPSPASASLFQPPFSTVSSAATSTLSQAGPAGSQPNSPNNLVGDPVLGSSLNRFAGPDSNFGSYPVQILTPIVSALGRWVDKETVVTISIASSPVPSNVQVRLSKILNLKKEKVCALRDMNTEAERRESIGETVATDFQRRYARTILDLEELNTELNNLLVKVRQQCQEVDQVHQSIYYCEAVVLFSIIRSRLPPIRSKVYLLLPGLIASASFAIRTPAIWWRCR